jgi:hypothetical protein
MNSPPKIVLLLACTVAAVLFCGVTGRAQTGPADETDIADALTRCESFLKGLSSDVPSAYDTLLRDSPLREKGKVEKVAADTKKLFATDAPNGRLRKDGVERVKTHRVGSDLVLLRYLQKFENVPVVWYFTFYYTGDRWVLVTVRFDHEYELLGL